MVNNSDSILTIKLLRRIRFNIWMYFSVDRAAPSAHCTEPILHTECQGLRMNIPFTAAVVPSTTDFFYVVVPSSLTHRQRCEIQHLAEKQLPI